MQAQYIPAQPSYPAYSSMQPLQYVSMARNYRRQSRIFCSQPVYERHGRAMPLKYPRNRGQTAVPSMKQQRRSSVMYQQRITNASFPSLQSLQPLEPYYLLSGREVGELLHRSHGSGDAITSGLSEELRKSRNRNSRIIGPSSDHLRKDMHMTANKKLHSAIPVHSQPVTAQLPQKTTLQINGSKGLLRSSVTSGTSNNRDYVPKASSSLPSRLPSSYTGLAPPTGSRKSTAAKWVDPPGAKQLTVASTSKQPISRAQSQTTPNLQRSMSTPPARGKQSKAEAVKVPMPDMPASTRSVPVTTTLKSMLERTKSAPEGKTSNKPENLVPKPAMTASTPPITQSASLPTVLPSRLPLPGSKPEITPHFAPQDGDYVTINRPNHLSSHLGLVHETHKPNFSNGYTDTKVFDTKAGGAEWYKASEQLSPAPKEYRNKKKPPAEGISMKVSTFDQRQLPPLTMAL